MAPAAVTCTVVAVIAAKGGVGKTTLAANLCMALAERGNRVMGIDLDPQNALRFHLVDDLQPDDSGWAHAWIENCPWVDAMCAGRGGVVVLPFGSIDDEHQMYIERHLSEHPNWLGETLTGFQLPNDTIVVLDTPPGPSAYLQQALRISHVNVVTLMADAGSFATLPIIERMVDKYCRSRADFVANSYIVNQIDASKRLNRDVLQTLLSDLDLNILGAVHEDQALREALAAGVAIRRYAPTCQAVQDLAGCTDQLMLRLSLAAVQAPATQLKQRTGHH